MVNKHHGNRTFFGHHQDWWFRKPLGNPWEISVRYRWGYRFELVWWDHGEKIHSSVIKHGGPLENPWTGHAHWSRKIIELVLAALADYHRVDDKFPRTSWQSACLDSCWIPHYWFIKQCKINKFVSFILPFLRVESSNIITNHDCPWHLIWGPLCMDGYDLWYRGSDVIHWSSVDWV